MEKPAVIMNEAAFKMLLEALTGKKISVVPTDDQGVDSSAVDNYLKGYYEQNNMHEKPGRPTKRDYESEYQAVKDFMYGQPPMKLMDIWKHMTARGLWNCELKQAGNRLSGIMERYNGIYKVGRGMFEMPFEVGENLDLIFNGDEVNGDE